MQVRKGRLDRLPSELLYTIAKLMPLDSRLNFRLVTQKLAAATTPRIGQHLAVVAITCCLEEFRSCIELTEISQYTQHLTIYHAKWPVCTRQAWEVHPLLLGGKDRSDVLRNHGEAAAEAFHSYKIFISQESLCSSASLLRILEALPNLTTITIDPLQRRRRNRLPCFDRVQRTIWLEPNIRDTVNVDI